MGLTGGDGVGRIQSSCESCVNYVYDEDCGYYVCQANLDEDDMARFMSRAYKRCPYFKNGDEYRVARRQM